MKNNISIIISHYNPEELNKSNPLFLTLKKIAKQKKHSEIEIIIADDGSKYSESIIEDYSKTIKINNDVRDIYILESEKLKTFLKYNNFNTDLIKKWVYLPKYIKCMSKARVINYAVQEAANNNLLFLDDDNYFISLNTIQNLQLLFEKYDFIVGQIKDNNGRLRDYASKRVQGTTIAIKKDVFIDVKGFSEWTEKFSCGVDSDFWIKLYNKFSINENLKACYTNKISTYDSYSKRWKKYTKFLQDFALKKEFNNLYSIKNYKSSKYNLSRNKKLWISNLIENE